MLPDWLPNSLWDEFRKMRTKIKHPMTSYAETLILVKLDKWHTQGADCEAIINESIERSWAGVFLNGHAKGGQSESPTGIHDVAGVASAKTRCCLCGGSLQSGFVFCSQGRRCHEC